MKKNVILSLVFTLMLTSCTIDCWCPEPISYNEIDFEGFALPSKGYMDEELNGAFKQGGVTFYSDWVSEYGGYSNGGIYLSNMKDQYTVGLSNQYSSVANYSSQFAVVHYSPYNAENGKNWASFTFDKAVEISSIKVSNSTYAYWAMRTGEDGIGVCRPYKDGDWFKVIFTGYNIDGKMTGSVEHYLADFRDERMYISTDWEYVYLSSLGEDVIKVEISIEGTDTGEFGLNTPTYCCIDDISYRYK